LKLGCEGFEMPFPRNWAEELVAEWLTLRGYLVLTNVRLRGRREVDVIGFKVLDDGGYEVFHVEVGAVWEKADKTVERIGKRFSEKCVSDVLKVLGYYAGCKIENPRYKKWFIVTGGSPGVIEEVKRRLQDKGSSVKVITLKEFVKIILDDVEKWQKYMVNSRLRDPATTVATPENLWLIGMLIVVKDTYKLEERHATNLK
jgi:Holliday junction resolvase-like predicted endonuclease